ncbi:MAG TPA: hypothetical protein VKY40_09435, partial [Halanaerobiales bacterium]|nr:hypothetical protein [Halanaerobiales bacterium]
MSGIAVVYDDDDPALIKDVLNRMKHRGSETAGVVQTPKATLGYTSFKKEKKELNSQRVAVADSRVLPSFPGENSTKVEKIKKDDGL